MTSFKLNTANAKQVGQLTSIEQRGAYTGKFVLAEHIVSRQGTKGIEFAFQSDEGQFARYLSVWYENKDGKELSGRRMIDAIMTCVGVREMTVAEAMVKKWDSEQRAEVNVRAHVLPELMNKAIGVVLVREEYEDNSGHRKWRNLLVSPFEAATRRIASERLDNKPAEALERLLASLRDRPLREGAPARSTAGAGAGGSGFDDLDNDIPF